MNENDVKLAGNSSVTIDIRKQRPSALIRDELLANPGLLVEVPNPTVVRLAGKKCVPINSKEATASIDVTESSSHDPPSTHLS